jgi:hypothetical protein
VAIDTKQVGSPGWWLKRLYNMLAFKERQDRLVMLRNYRVGKPPPPSGGDASREAYEGFVKKARLNLAELVVTALSERLKPVGFRTGLDNDETGDETVGAMWQRAGMDIESANVHDMLLTFGEAYVIVGAVDDLTGAPIVTSEDPRWIVGDPDPMRPRTLRAALKIVYDDMLNEDRAYLYLPGAVLVARHSGPAASLSRLAAGAARRGPLMTFSEQTWEWDRERSGEVPHGRIPVVRFTNKDEMGEFEAHIDTLERINHQILQTMVIGTMQAFRVRAIKNLPLTDPQTGKEVDYSNLLSLDPGSVWQLPEGVDLWESETTDLRPLLQAIQDDMTRLASATRTPMHMLHPGGQNQSAEGASLQREGLVFKAEDRIERIRYPWAQVASLMMLVAGDKERADLGKLYTLFAPPERLSLAERADAAVKAAGDLPLKTRLVKIWHMSPAEAERVMSEREAELVLQAQLTQVTAAGPQPVGAAQQGQQQDANAQPGQQPGQQQGGVQPGQQAGGGQPAGNQPQITGG